MKTMQPLTGLTHDPFKMEHDQTKKNHSELLQKVGRLTSGELMTGGKLSQDGMALLGTYGEAMDSFKEGKMPEHLYARLKTQYNQFMRSQEAKEERLKSYFQQPYVTSHSAEK